MQFPRTTQQYWNMRSKTNPWLVLAAGIALIACSMRAEAYVDLLHIGREHIYMDLKPMYEAPSQDPRDYDDSYRSPQNERDSSAAAESNGVGEKND